MNLFSLNKNSLALILVGAVAIGFFVAGLFEVLNYFILQILLFLGYATLVVLALTHAIKNERKKNRPEDNLQDDSN
jgi:membrane protein implicated in regulation of membrane protease activity